MILLMSLEETVLRTRRAILEAPLTRRIRIIVIILMVVVLLSLVLLELVPEVELPNSVLLLSQDWDWCVFVVEMPITVGVVSVLGVARTTRRWCAKRTQIVSWFGSQLWAHLLDSVVIHTWWLVLHLGCSTLLF
jgi:hypothetical protein